MNRSSARRALKKLGYSFDRPVRLSRDDCPAGHPSMRAAKRVSGGRVR